MRALLASGFLIRVFRVQVTIKLRHADQMGYDRTQAAVTRTVFSDLTDRQRQGIEHPTPSPHFPSLVFRIRFSVVANWYGSRILYSSFFRFDSAKQYNTNNEPDTAGEAKHVVMFVCEGEVLG